MNWIPAILATLMLSFILWLVIKATDNFETALNLFVVIIVITIALALIILTAIGA